MPVAGARDGKNGHPVPGDAQPPEDDRGQEVLAEAQGMPIVPQGVLCTSVRVPAPRNPVHGRPIADGVFETTDVAPGRPYITLRPPTGGAAWHLKGGDARQITWGPDMRMLTFLLSPRARASKTNRVWEGWTHGWRVWKSGQAGLYADGDTPPPPDEPG